MKITVIFTGGTIGSTAGSGGYISPDGGKPRRLLKLYQELCKEEGICEHIDFQTEEPFQILSENMNAEYINRLISYVEHVLKKRDSKGIIITHGTDTIQYTAAVLSYIFGINSLPIVLVSSDFPLEDSRANGLTNFRYAIDFIKNGYGKGVFVSYCNQGENPMIHRGTRLLGHLPYSAALYSVKNRYYGEYKDNEYLPNKNYDSEYFNSQKDSSMEESSGNSEYFPARKCFDNMNDMQDRESFYRICENKGAILRIFPYVGMSYPALTDNVKVVLHDSYHSGTIRISRELERFMAEAEKCRVSVYITGIAGDEKNYETVRDYKELGIHILSGISPIAAYCKLWLALSNRLDIEQVMKTCIAEDIC